MSEGTEFTTWTTLACPDCGGERFTRVYSLITRVNGGTTETPQGWECQQCRTQCDLGAMHAGASLKQLEQEIQQRRDQMAALKPLPQPKTP
jgi:ribosomal protein L37AE/L43A